MQPPNSSPLPTQRDLISTYRREIARRKALLRHSKALHGVLAQLARTFQRFVSDPGVVAELRLLGVVSIPASLRDWIERERAEPAVGVLEPGPMTANVPCDRNGSMTPEICTAAEALMGDAVPAQTRHTIRYLSPDQQVEALTRMAAFGAHTYDFALSLLVTDPIALGRTHRDRRRRLAAERATIAQIHGADFEQLLESTERSYAKTCIDASLIAAYLKQLLGTPSVRALLSARFPACLTKLAAAVGKAEAILSEGCLPKPNSTRRGRRGPAHQQRTRLHRASAN